MQNEVMNMEIINIYGENRFPEYRKIREACRGIVINDGKILLTYEVNTDQWFLPGGGREGKESIAQCCIRELAEETGCVVNPILHYLTINEYYVEWLFISHYFVCEITGETQRLLTEHEVEAGLEPRWIPMEEAISIFSNYRDDSYHEMKKSAYLREFKALSEYFKSVAEKK
jgi:8-oxo-dGTP pyrophosphatase MutT (NUDIX family)